MEPVQFNKNIVGGEPCIIGTRIPVRLIAFLKLKKKLDSKAIIDDYYGYLTEQQINQAVDWYVTNKTLVH